MKEFWKQSFVTAATVIVMMLAFWLVEGREYISRAEVEHFVEQRVSERFERVLEVEQALKDNTKVINELRIQLAVLNETLKHIQKDNNVK